MRLNSLSSKTISQHSVIDDSIRSTKKCVHFDVKVIGMWIAVDWHCHLNGLYFDRCEKLSGDVIERLRVEMKLEWRLLKEISEEVKVW